MVLRWVGETFFDVFLPTARRKSLRGSILRLIASQWGGIRFIRVLAFPSGTLKMAVAKKVAPN